MEEDDPSRERAPQPDSTEAREGPRKGGRVNLDDQKTGEEEGAQEKVQDADWPPLAQSHDDVIAPERQQVILNTVDGGQAEALDGRFALDVVPEPNHLGRGDAVVLDGSLLEHRRDAVEGADA
jgi:hypothetical protein